MVHVGRDLTKTFDHKIEESSIYAHWEQSGAFKPRGTGTPYCIPMPPPNITGILHMGHALFATLQDILIRFRRMQGYDALWLPGTDHAGLATQEKLDAQMRAKGLDPQGPDFAAFAADYKKNLHGTITQQIRRCGASCDWEREIFTLDDRYSATVSEALRRCYAQGMLYRHDGQWWLHMNYLAARLLRHLDQGDIQIFPAHQEKTLRHFLENIEPWCISRQIRWGHRLPIWHDQGGWNLDGDGAQESDVLDTWFSSALWPFAIHGWPDDTADLRRYYPAALIETADDILFFWCARMLMMGLLLTDELPFRTIYLHGIIRDKQGRKMQKSLGNGIDPLQIIDKFGCDAMRMGLAENTTAGLDINLSDDKFESAKRLANKLWQASRFCLGHYDRMGRPPIARPSPNNETDATLLREFDEAASKATAALDSYDFREAAMTLRHFLWDRFCSWYIEQAKTRLYADDAAALQTLMWTLQATLRLLHPFMPFITERIWRASNNDLLILADWRS